MKEFKGTKGEWIMDCTDKSIEEHPNHLPIKNNKCTLITLVNHSIGDININEYDGNAKLIAAAPDLLEALQTLYNQVKSTGLRLKYGMNKAEKAIDKALK